MKIFNYIRKYPNRFLILSLFLLCLVYSVNIVYLKYKLNDWYNRYIDKSQSGIRVFYYPNEDWRDSFTETEIVQELSYSNSINKKFQNNMFSLRAIGIFSPPKSGHYKLFLKSDDGSLLYIDHNLIIDNSGIHPASSEMAKTIFLRKGPHLVVIEYFQAYGKAELGFGWLETGETGKGINLDSHFNPVSSEFRWDKDMNQLSKLLRLPYDMYLYLLAIAILTWFPLRFWRKIYLLFISVFGKYKIFNEKYEYLSISILFIAVLIIIFNPILFKGKTFLTVPGASDCVVDPGSAYWAIIPFSFFNHYMYKSWQLPLWNPYNALGTPMAGQTSACSFFPPMFPVFMYPCSWSLDIYYLFRFFWIGIFTYAFTRAISLSRISSFIASFCFMLCCYNVAYLNEFWLNGIMILPSFLFFIEKYIKERKKIYFWGVPVCILFSELAGNPQITINTLILGTGYAMVRIFVLARQRNLSFSNEIKWFFLLVFCGIGLSSFTLLPFVELYLSGWSEHVNWGLTVDSIRNIRFFLFESFSPSAHYLNIYCLWMIPVALFFSKRIRVRNITWFFFIYLCFYLAKYFGLPWIQIIGKMPILSSLLWTRYAYTIPFSAAVITGIGIEVLLKMNRGKWDFLWIIFEFWLFIFLILKFSKGEFILKDILIKHLLQYSCLLLLTIGLLFEEKLKIRKQVLIVFATIILIYLYQLIPSSRCWRGDQEPYNLSPEVQFVKEKLSSSEEPFRVEAVGLHGNFKLDPQRNCIYEISSIHSTHPIMIKRFKDFLTFYRALEIRQLKRMLNLVNVKYIFSNDELENYLNKGVIRRFLDGNWYVYENTEVMPRAFIAHKVKIISNKEDIFKTLIDESFDYRNTVIFEDEAILKENLIDKYKKSYKSSVKVIRYTPTTIILESESNNNGFLIVSDIFYPGWKVYVDGKKCKIFVANYFMRAVHLQKGKHHVAFRYKPLSFRIGSIISLFFVIILLVGSQVKCES